MNTTSTAEPIVSADLRAAIEAWVSDPLHTQHELTTTAGNILVLDPQGDVHLGHGTILVMGSRDLELFQSPGATRMDRSHLVVLDESHRVGGLDPVTTAAAMEALRSLVTPAMSPSDAIRASDIQSAHKPNRKARRQAQRAARRLQRRS